MSDESTNGKILPLIARESVASRFGNGAPQTNPEPTGYLGRRAGVFVTIKTHDGYLRGCRGTIQPRYANVIEETRKLAQSSAFNDDRFAPVVHSELDKLTYEVSVLHEPEPARALNEFDPTRYGIIVQANDGRRALMLPNVEGLDTVEKQFNATCRKGDIDPKEAVTLERFQVDKFTEPK